MSWCNKLASTPTFGFKISPHFAASEEILDRLSPLLNTLFDGEKSLFSIEAIEAFALIFNTESGYRYSFDFQKASIQFNHRIRARPVSGGLPVMEMLSSPKQFTDLLPDVLDKLIDVTLCLPQIKNRRMQRVGVISNTSVDEADLPPGLAGLISYMGRPWVSGVQSMNLSLIAEIHSNANYSDRCVHTIVVPEDKTNLITLQFDWQRTFQVDRPITDVSLRAIGAEAMEGALSYFERLAEGSDFDENVLCAQS